MLCHPEVDPLLEDLALWTCKGMHGLCARVTSNMAAIKFFKINDSDIGHDLTRHCVRKCPRRVFTYRVRICMP